ncbi:hypothetical protein L195_g023541 [Trifolium pratense]|uniref:Uncharacterized protein n=1 Tax=Trifolium pratense TaxID=57577 RepID=A0A2K3NB69_TRIPR|nr:hypothetical protein L195_g023541 [Trifolium pratense]
MVSVVVLPSVLSPVWPGFSATHQTLTQFAIKFCLVLLSPHMTLFASSYCVSQLLLQPLLQLLLLSMCRLTLLHLSQILINEVVEEEDVEIIGIDPVVNISTVMATSGYRKGLV